MTAKKRAGFSLVELVIVIVILGVIAAIAVPRISRGAKGADESAVRQDLSILRTAIEMYSAEHGGKFPGSDGSEATMKDQLLKFTNKAGTASDTKTGQYIYGPYLRKQVPPLPVGAKAGLSAVKMVNTAPAVDASGDYGWIFNYTTGEIIANCDDATETDPNVSYDEW
ncbi:MAG: prepilin-type N-terminal cleavage/methylation domain-containing protein [Phycisphaerae bacterium]|nr:prepilin-type N-terminal cleavage/methylation domain-containing protein [Phycisphaerae bacterium]